MLIDLHLSALSASWVQFRLTLTELSARVNASVKGSVPLDVQGVTPPLPQNNWDRFQQQHDSECRMNRDRK